MKEEAVNRVSSFEDLSVLECNLITDYCYLAPGAVEERSVSLRRVTREGTWRYRKCEC